ncbi:MAG: hypothetical protein CTY18_03120 [Methylomonas sp.]|nr:MAG: hypothetical protein CTY18_03120 [Methylomonas sp.]
MRHKIKFQSILPLPIRQYDFVWDDASGILSGSAIDDVKDWSMIVLSQGFIDCPEIGGLIPAFNPLKNINEFSAMIGFDNLPDSLRPFFPDINYPGFSSYSADNNSVDINFEVLY